MSRFEALLAVVDRYQKLAAENYTRVRLLAGELRAGLCDYIDAGDGICVRLVPPFGPFEAKDYGDHAFSVAPQGFRPLGPVQFGLAVRVTRAEDWMRVTVECQKIGETFIARVSETEEFTLALPLAEHGAAAMYDYLYRHVMTWFEQQIDHYEAGDYGHRDIGFDFSRQAQLGSGG